MSTQRLVINAGSNCHRCLHLPRDCKSRNFFFCCLYSIKKKSNTTITSWRVYFSISEDCFSLQLILLSYKNTVLQESDTGFNEPLVDILPLYRIFLQHSYDHFLRSIIAVKTLELLDAKDL